MTVPLPYRLAGYGAYNLVFDKYLGRNPSVPNDTDFFATLFNNGFRKINLVKVICFRHSQAESLPEGRAVPLYTPAHQISEAFKENLAALVARAAEYHFWVQVCIFHHQAIATPEGRPNENKELPESLPPELAPRGDTECDRLRNFFNPRPSIPAQLQSQKDLVKAIVTRLKDFNNVIYEIGNELRIGMLGDPPSSTCTVADNQALVEWLNIMGQQIISVIGPTNNIGTSTGAYKAVPTPSFNEVTIFQTGPRPFSPGFFDFHRGQWNSGAATQEDLDDTMNKARERVDGYKEGDRHFPLIINDDGGGPERTAANVGKWARTAFSKGLHYATKQNYPNGGRNKEGQVLKFDFNVLTALNDAAKI